MIFDTAQQVLSENQAVTATAISENVILWETISPDFLGLTAPTPSRASPPVIPFLVQVTADFATLTSLTITLEHADNAALSSGNEVLWSSGAIPAASLVAGFQVPIHYLPGNMTKDYLGLRYTVGGSNATAGTIFAGITMGIQTNG